VWVQGATAGRCQIAHAHHADNIIEISPQHWNPPMSRPDRDSQRIVNLRICHHGNNLVATNHHIGNALITKNE
jgi:hypothetical protein